MSQYLELIWDKMEEDQKHKETIQTVVEACFQAEQLEDKKLVLSITLTIPEEIRKLNKQYRNIDQETDVLSFPMFEKEEIEQILKKYGDKDTYKLYQIPYKQYENKLTKKIKNSN